MRVRITPARAYVHGHIETLLIQMGVTPPPRRPDGIVELDLSEQQISTFALKGNAHKLERIADGAATETPAVPAAPPAPPVPESPALTLACSVCGTEFNVPRAMVPKVGRLPVDCMKCGAALSIEGTKIVQATPKAEEQHRGEDGRFVK